MSIPADPLPGSLDGVLPRDAGDPEYPAPWTTRQAREGLRDNGQARIVSLAPSVNLTPSGGGMVPVPYPVSDECDHRDGYASKTFYTSQRVLRYCDKTAHVHGDEAGTGGGVVSGTHGGVCEPIGHSAKVRVEGSEVVRHLDRFWMNDRNTVGEALFARDMSLAAAPNDDDPLPGSARLVRAGGGVQLAQAQLAPQGVQSDAAPATLPRFQPQPAPRPPGEVIQGPWRAQPPPQPEPEPPGLPWYVRWGRWGVLGLFMLIPGDTPLIPPLGRDADQTERDLNDQATRLLRPMQDGYNERVRAWYFEQLRRYREDKARRQQPAAPPVPQGDPARISREEEDRDRCLVGPYGEIVGACRARKGETHHIVPDMVYRLGDRPTDLVRMNSTADRIPNAPTLNQGMSICLTAGQHRSDEDAVHKSLNPALVKLGDQHEPAGTAPISEILDRSTEALSLVNDVSAECKLLAITRTNLQVRPLGSQPGRTTMLPPTDSKVIDVLTRGHY